MTTKRKKKKGILASFSSASQTLANGLFLSGGPKGTSEGSLSTLDPRVLGDGAVDHPHALVRRVGRWVIDGKAGF